MENERDGSLLRRYAETRSEAAFAELVRRYAGLVYATCLREIGDRTLAEDASQGVFLLLCRKASALQRSETIAGWLYAAARYVAKNLLKQERRRRMNEARAAESVTPAADAGNALWDRIEPHLHDALNRLKTKDREAVLLRFVAEQSFTEVGSRLGLSENTARMRVNRAMEKIRAHLAKIGVAVTVGLLAVLLEERAAQAAPAQLLQALPLLATGNAVPVLSSTLPLPAGISSRLHIGIALGGGAALLILFLAWRLLPQHISPMERRQLFESMAGDWKGSLEFADDRTLQRYTYPTTVTFRTLNQGDVLEFTATYTGSSAVDITTFNGASNSGRVNVSNSGPQSSHRLSGAGALVKRQEGGVIFQGDNAVNGAEVRLLILPQGNRLTLQEEYRRQGQTRYQFRNRFTLSK